MTRAATIAALILAVAAAAPAHAGVKASGYLKDFWQYSRSAIDGRAWTLITVRARLSLDAEKSWFRARADYDHQVAAGSWFRTTEYRLFGYQPPRPWLGAQDAISTGTTNGWGHGLYRGWLGLEGERGVLRAGRQRVAWGTGKLWNPTDVLNPFDPLSVDAVYGRLGVGALGQLELVWAPEDRWVDHAVLARGRAQLREGLDGSLMAGKVAGSTASLMGGGDFAATLFEGTLHGELAYFAPEIRTPYWKAGLGYDYSFPSETKLWGLKDATFTAEWYHSGRGATERARYDFDALRTGREQAVGRDYLGAQLSKDVHPLVKVEATAAQNLHDKSTFAAPSATWNVVQSLYLTAAWRRFGGERTTEYGRQPNQVVLTGQWWF